MNEYMDGPGMPPKLPHWSAAGASFDVMCKLIQSLCCTCPAKCIIGNPNGKGVLLSKGRRLLMQAGWLFGDGKQEAWCPECVQAGKVACTIPTPQPKPLTAFSGQHSGSQGIVGGL